MHPDLGYGFSPTRQAERPRDRVVIDQMRPIAGHRLMTFITADGEVVGGRGGNALLYLPIERAVRDAAFASAELPQVAETAVRMRRELDRLDPNQDAPRIWGQVVNSRSDPPNPSSVRRF